MPADHRIAAILPCRDLQASTAFYQRLGLTLDSDWGDYCILSDGNGWHLHLRHEPTTPQAPDNPFGLYLYAEDVDAIAARVRDAIIEPGAPHLKPWGMYEFAVSDPDGVLVRVGREA
ncbi:catechol 2,3-dioxygenase-like lactoylglutathione lyase family enzyme [Sphingomonas sp. BE123]|uniref:VOC family protein n=1 Tax=Sphingomonas sp. BE123 TaxID=2817842 RepID=UPI00285BEBCB|nr:VOC family protein [Sphingomonas sp. BE123]MDR6852797.1 catechol 2,3-dioxygenase-like lactoylglutathione lyase family enzyme [Sphingomonas sp. BE123]